MLANSTPNALLAQRAPTTVLADSRPTALLAAMALTTVLADRAPTALLAPKAPLPVRTTAAHLACRPGLHPVLAWPLCGRGSLPLRPLARRVLRHLDLDVHIRERPTHVRPPDRWHPNPAPRPSAPRRNHRIHRAAPATSAQRGSKNLNIGRAPFGSRDHSARARRLRDESRIRPARRSEGERGSRLS